MFLLTESGMTGILGEKKLPKLLNHLNNGNQIRSDFFSVKDWFYTFILKTVSRQTVK